MAFNKKFLLATTFIAGLAMRHRRSLNSSRPTRMKMKKVNR
jgi:hypothetical protein